MSLFCPCEPRSTRYGTYTPRTVAKAVQFIHFCDFDIYHVVFFALRDGQRRVGTALRLPDDADEGDDGCVP